MGLDTQVSLNGSEQMCVYFLFFFFMRVTFIVPFKQRAGKNGWMDKRKALGYHAQCLLATVQNCCDYWSLAWIRVYWAMCEVLLVHMRKKKKKLEKRTHFLERCLGLKIQVSASHLNERLAWEIGIYRGVWAESIWCPVSYPCPFCHGPSGRTHLIFSTMLSFLGQTVECTQDRMC